MTLSHELKKSSFSGNGGCVGAQLGDDDNVVIKDFKDLSKAGITTIKKEGWAAFIQECKDGEFDL